MKLLIVIDMQNDFIDGALGSPEAQAIVPNVKKKIEQYRNDPNGFVIYTADTHHENYLDTMEGKKLPVPHCIKGTDGWMLNNKVQTALDKKTYKVIEKPTFGSVELAEYIKANYNIAEIEIELIGLCTDICVISNAMVLKAAFPEVLITVDSSCSAGVTVESHNTALEAMRAVQIEIV